MALPHHDCQPPILSDDPAEIWWLLKTAFPTAGKAKAYAAKESGFRFTDMRCRGVWLRPRYGKGLKGACWTETFPGDPQGFAFWQIESSQVWLKDITGQIRGIVHRDYAYLHTATSLAAPPAF